MFVAERGVSGIPVPTVDLRGGENRQAPYLAEIPLANILRCNWTMAAT